MGKALLAKLRIRKFTECGKRDRLLGENTGVLSEYGRYVSRKAKVHLELNLARDIKDKTSYFKDISSRGKT